MNTWHTRLSGARSVDEVVWAARDFLASWSYEDMAAVPSACRPTRIKGVDDIAFWRSQLVEEYCRHAAVPDRTAEVLRDLLAFFTTASERASALAGNHPVRDLGLFSDRSLPRLFAGTTDGPEKRRDRA
jgi:hypothetical protein